MNTAYKPEYIAIDELKLNDTNPRHIEDNKFAKLVKSVKNFPAMLEIRPIVIDENNVILGGNMRYKACIKAGLKEVPVVQVDNLTEAQKQEFIIKDNVGFGSWDWEILTEEWDTALLDDWGLELGVDLNAEDFGEDFDLPDGDKEPFTQMTFTLADAQAKLIKEELAKIKKSAGFKQCETFENENGNGNALYLMVVEWAEQKK